MPELITLSCPTCGAKTGIVNRTGEDFAGLTRFHCEYCGNDHLLNLPAKPAPQPVAPLRPKVPIPESVRIEKDGKGAVIIQRWFSLKYVPMVFFCLVWDSFLCFWYSMAFSSNVPWIFIVFPLGHLAVGIGLTYSTLAGFVNRTCLELTRDKLSIWFEPLPWLGEKTFQTADIQQLFCRETVTHRKRSTTTRYHLYALTRDGHEVKLLSNIESPEIARFFEQQLESWLKIEDRPVQGEMAY